MSIFSRLFRLFRSRKATDEDPEAFARKIHEAFAGSQGKLMPPDLGVTIQCECGRSHYVRLQHFNPIGGMEVTCADCGAVTFVPPEILDHTKQSPQRGRAMLRPDYRQLTKIVRHGKTSPNA